MNLRNVRIGIDWAQESVAAVAINYASHSLNILATKEWSDQEAARRELPAWVDRWEAPCIIHCSAVPYLLFPIEATQNRVFTSDDLPTEDKSWRTFDITHENRPGKVALLEEPLNALLADLKTLALPICGLTLSPLALSVALGRSEFQSPTPVLFRYPLTASLCCHFLVANNTLQGERTFHCLRAQEFNHLLHSASWLADDLAVEQPPVIVWLATTTDCSTPPPTEGLIQRDVLTLAGSSVPTRLLPAIGAALTPDEALCKPAETTNLSWPLSQRTLQRIRLTALVVFGLLLITTILLGIRNHQLALNIHNLTERVHQKAAGLAITLPTSWESDPKAAIEFMRSQKQPLIAYSQAGEPTLVGLLAELSQAVAADSAIVLDELQSENGLLEFAGVAANYEDLNHLQSALHGLDQIKQVNLTDSVTLSNGNVRFRFSVRTGE